MTLQSNHGSDNHEDKAQERPQVSTTGAAQEAEAATAEVSGPGAASAARPGTGDQHTAWPGWGWLLGLIVGSWDHTLRAGFLLGIVLVPVAIVAALSAQWFLALGTGAVPALMALVLLVRGWLGRGREPQPPADQADPA
ncbi:hypothetical protein [Saccharomonospora xinjiangensis]|uniref:Uncharacterized protein n=1 Tax=Saccharomonospora xinjiangensis XJ-54 TaxID=882086 RepID=I0V7B5_9PSEU|nr:hypothetical protein [Saccharomonospora xinjiangensis]EID56018.1 hypothetical protein SacxiDRAFT_3826 [Saccharomonospora xinjiangensis XJ-54]